jgi:mannosyltransferase
VHSIALGLFEDAGKIHWFRDIGYRHAPYFNCPRSPKCKGCEPDLFTDGDESLNEENCLAVWFEHNGKG